MPSNNLSNNEIGDDAEKVSSLLNKLQKLKQENSKLKKSFQNKARECEELEDELNYKSGRIADLEHQCMSKATALSQMTDVVETTSQNHIDEKFMEKSMSLSQALSETERLGRNNQHLKKENRRLKDENKDLNKDNTDMFQKLDRMAKEKEKNQQLMIEIADIIRTLKAVKVSFDAESQAAMHTSGQNSGVAKIKLKIEAMESDRQKLKVACNQLRDETSRKGHRINELEDMLRSSPHERRLRVQSSRSSSYDFDTERCAEQCGSSFYSSSQESIQGSTDGGVSPTEFKTLKGEYEKTLERVVEISEELSETQVSLLEFKRSSRRAELEHKEALREISLLERELEESIRKFENLTKENGVTVSEYDTKITELSDYIESMKKHYDGKLLELDKEVETYEHHFTKQSAETKKKHEEETQELKRENYAMKLDQAMALEQKQKDMDDLNYEYETFLQMHNALEDQQGDLKKQNESLITMNRTLQTDMREAASLFEDRSNQLEKSLSVASASEDAQRKLAEESRSAMQEAVLQSQRLRRENEATVKRLRELQQLQGKEASIAENIQRDHARVLDQCEALKAALEAETKRVAVLKSLDDSHQTAFKELIAWYDETKVSEECEGSYPNNHDDTFTGDDDAVLNYIKYIKEEIHRLCDGQTSAADVPLDAILQHVAMNRRVLDSLVNRQNRTGALSSKMVSSINASENHRLLLHQKKLHAVHFDLLNGNVDLVGMDNVSVELHADDDLSVSTSGDVLGLKGRVYRLQIMLRHALKMSGGVESMRLQAANPSGAASWDTEASTDFPPDIDAGTQLNVMRTNIRSVESQVKLMSLGISNAREKLGDAKRRQVIQEKEFQHVLSQMQKRRHSTASTAAVRPNAQGLQESYESVDCNSFHEPSRVDQVDSFETSGHSASSGEGRDERTKQPRNAHISSDDHGSAETNAITQLQCDYDVALTQLAITKQELNEALEELAKVSKKQADCEAYLRDVIFHYKVLEKELASVTPTEEATSILSGDTGSFGSATPERMTRRPSESTIIRRRGLKLQSAMKTRGVTNESFDQVLVDYKQLQSEHEEVVKKVAFLANTGTRPNKTNILGNASHTKGGKGANKKMKKVFKGLGMFIPPLSPHQSRLS